MLTERLICSEPDSAEITMRYVPSATPVPEAVVPFQVTVRGPAGRSALASSVRATAPDEAFTTLTATTARRESLNEILDRSLLVSPLGVRVRGAAVSPVIASGGGPGTGPVAERVSDPALIS
jgi:hypothetical protein